MKICIATENTGKLEEIIALLHGIPLEFVISSQLGIRVSAEETGSTYAENATIKGLAYARQTGLISLADDSGLEVQALRGAPGLYSARYVSTPGATDKDRRKFLVSNLQAHPRPWKARFTCSVCVALPDGTTWLTSGECKGEIIPEERGEMGFGYDPVFLVAGAERTMAELSMDEKNTISHRARAVRAAIPILRRLMSEHR